MPFKYYIQPIGVTENNLQTFRHARHVAWQVYCDFPIRHEKSNNLWFLGFPTHRLKTERTLSKSLTVHLSPGCVSKPWKPNSWNTHSNSLHGWWRHKFDRRRILSNCVANLTRNWSVFIQSSERWVNFLKFICIVQQRGRRAKSRCGGRVTSLILCGHPHSRDPLSKLELPLLWKPECTKRHDSVQMNEDNLIICFNERIIMDFILREEMEMNSQLLMLANDAKVK